MRVTIDIHSYDRLYDNALALLSRSNASTHNKTLIQQFCDACLVRQVCGKVRLIRAIGILAQFAEDLGKDFERAQRADLERLITTLLSRKPPYSPETIATYKRILRRFMTYVTNPATFPHVSVLPEHVAWINGHLRKRDRPMVKRADLLVPEEIERLQRGTDNDRDRAFVSVLWEAGPRIAEIGNMQIKDVQPTAVGYTLTISGKTGTRSPLVVSSAPYLSRWLATHPRRNDPEAPLWLHRQGSGAVGYNALSVMLQRLFRRCGITKPSHPHIFRHSRVTYVLANGLMNEQQAKLYFGWAPDSDMPGSTYAHLLDTDVNNAILRENGLAPQQLRARELQPVTCHICSDLNPPKSEYCQRCHAVLNLSRAYEHQQLHDLKEELFTQMFKLMVQKGLVDEAAREIHDAGLGATLKRLAQHMKGEQPIASNVKREP